MSASTSRPEIDLLLCAVRASETPDSAILLERCLRQPIDWDFAGREAMRHGVLSLLREILLSRKDVPAAIQRRFDTAFCATAGHNLALAAELIRILEILRAHSIAAAPFKGPVLAAAVYGRQSARCFCDLDILIRETDLDRAAGLLAGLGYAPEFDLRRAGLAAYVRSEHALPLRHAESDIGIDLHWRLTERYLLRFIETDKILGRLTSTTLAGSPVPAFAPEDLLLYLAVHGAKHRWARLEWVRSFADLARGESGLNWPHLRKEAGRIGAGRALRLALLLARDLCRVDLPENVISRAERDPVAAALARTARKEMFVERRPTGSPASRVRGWWFLIRVAERPLDKFRMVLLLVFRLPHPESAEFLALPRMAAPLYYVLRPLRIVAQCLSALTGLRQ